MPSFIRTLKKKSSKTKLDGRSSNKDLYDQDDDGSTVVASNAAELVKPDRVRPSAVCGIRSIGAAAVAPLARILLHCCAPAPREGAVTVVVFAIVLLWRLYVRIATLGVGKHI
jgi:hypothetical protein